VPEETLEEEYAVQAVSERREPHMDVLKKLKIRGRKLGISKQTYILGQQQDVRIEVYIRTTAGCKNRSIY
jgi:hypothetical protein